MEIKSPTLQVVTEAHVTLKGDPVVAKTLTTDEVVTLLDDTHTILAIGWEPGQVTRVLSGGPAALEKLHPSWLEPADKGTPGLYTCNARGEVIAALAHFVGDPESSNVLERGPHFLIERAEQTHGYWRSLG